MLAGVTGGSHKRTVLLSSTYPDDGFCLKTWLHLTLLKCCLEHEGFEEHACSGLFLFAVGMLAGALPNALPKALR